MSADPIPPALSPEEWADYTADALSLRDILSSLGDGVGLHDDERVTARDLFPRATPERHHHAAMALHNFALPDDDPGKLTRAMVDDLRIAQHEARKAVGVDCMNGPCDECKAACERFCARLEQYARAVAALLPPTEDA